MAEVVTDGEIADAIAAKWEAQPEGTITGDTGRTAASYDLARALRQRHPPLVEYYADSVRSQAAEAGQGPLEYVRGLDLSTFFD